jgi:hypothetical protein
VTAGHPKVSMVGWEEFLALSWPRTTRTEGCVPMLYLGPKNHFRYAAKSLIWLAPRAGFERANQPVNSLMDRAGCEPGG